MEKKTIAVVFYLQLILPNFRKVLIAFGILDMVNLLTFNA